MRKTVFAVLIAFLLPLASIGQTNPPAKAVDFSKSLVKVAKPEPVPAGIRPGFETITAKVSLSMLTFIASDLMEGREAGTRGYQLAAEYAASLFGLWGLTPLGDAAARRYGLAQILSGAADSEVPPEKTFWQEFPLQETLETSTRMALDIRHGPAALNREFKAGVDYTSIVATGDILTAPVVFAGYGLTDAAAKYDDFKGLDVKGKVVLILAPDPPFIPKKEAPRTSGGIVWYDTPAKIEALFKRGPAAVLTVNPASPDMARYKSLLPAKSVPDEEPIIRQVFHSWTLPGEAVPMPWDKPALIRISNRTADAIMAAAGRTIATAQKAIDETGKPASFDVPGAALTIASTLNPPLDLGLNDDGRIEGSDPALKDECLVIGAHLDHEGRVDDYIYNGADDNGSGSVGVLNLARAFAANPQKPKRTIVFALWTGEEKGLLGSKYFAEHPPLRQRKIITYLNFDMMSRPYDEKSLAFASRMMDLPSSAEFLKAVTPANFMLINFSQASGLGQLAREADRYVGLDLYLREFTASTLSFGDSDHSSFKRRGIPWLWPFSAVTADLHQTSDSTDKVSGELMAKTSRLMYAIAWAVADR